uniref:Cadherin N-terminal domain-containing protein n=1 Tax=Paramormyrops kingsleyae TaxID=1676925 RepID=A0A3B3T9E5_9TELE
QRIWDSMLEVWWNVRHRAVFFVIFALWSSVGAVTRYSIPEEMKEGSVVANLAADLGLNVNSLAERELIFCKESMVKATIFLSSKP